MSFDSELGKLFAEHKLDLGTTVSLGHAIFNLIEEYKLDKQHVREALDELKDIIYKGDDKSLKIRLYLADNKIDLIKNRFGL